MTTPPPPILTHYMHTTELHRGEAEEKGKKETNKI